MIPKECKRLAEVDFPIAVVSKHAAREKSIRHGHPSTLHLWWARRPLAACRAMLLALLWPDPCDPHCPEDFKQKARELLPKVQGTVGPNDENLRQALLKFIGDFANWDLSSHPTYLEVSRALVRAAYPEEAPLVVDPFAGGGSIPLEALRLGCEAFASDLNPVACLILKVMLEDIPRHGPELAEELRRVGAEIKAAAEKELAEFYPADPDGSKPIAYLWARTVRCEAPNCGAEIPLMRSFWLCKKANRKRALRHKVVRPKDKPPEVQFEIFEPKNESEVRNGTVTRAKASCLCCGAVLPPERVRAQLSAQRGGADVVFDENGIRIGGARLLALVSLKSGEQSRHYRLPTVRDYEAVWKAQQRLAEVVVKPLPNGLSPVPDESTPVGGGSGAGRAFSVQRYGMMILGEMFTARQALSMSYLYSYTSTLMQSQAYLELLTIGLSKTLRHCNVLAKWHRGSETVAGAFGMQAMSMSWDFPEMFPLCPYAGGLDDSFSDVRAVFKTLNGSSPAEGQIQLADAADHPLPDETAKVWFTDPPYYDAIPYSDLSDFFYAWLKRAIGNQILLNDPFDKQNSLSPKPREIVQDETRIFEGRIKDSGFFESRMGRAFAEGRRLTGNSGLGCIVFAHKSTDGWEALLAGIIYGGWVISGSWPISTERGARLRARDSAALATSVHLVCRPRSEDAPTGDWAEVLRELPKRVGDWMERLQNEGIRGADLVFACIGPALEIFSRYSKVETAEGREVKLAEYLEKVWEEVGRAALRQILGIDAPTEIHEDARLTALFLWTARAANGASQAAIEGDQEIEDDDEDDSNTRAPRQMSAKGGYTLPYDIVRRFCQPLGIHLENWEGRLIEIQKGIVRLLPVKERTNHLLGNQIGQELAWLSSSQAKQEVKQLGLFESPTDLEKRKSKKERVGLALKRVELETWAHLHQDSVTVLDHVHQAMLFQKQGMTTALRELLFYQKTYYPEFLRLANALSALYPKESEEKRLLDAMLLAVPR